MYVISYSPVPQESCIYTCSLCPASIHIDVKSTLFIISTNLSAQTLQINGLHHTLYCSSPLGCFQEAMCRLPSPSPPSSCCLLPLPFPQPLPFTSLALPLSLSPSSLSFHLFSPWPLHWRVPNSFPLQNTGPGFGTRHLPKHLLIKVSPFFKQKWCLP